MEKRIALKDLRVSPVNTSTLSDRQLQRLRPIFEWMNELGMATAFEEFVRDFTRDMYPEREIRIWERMFDAYTKKLDAGTVTVEEKLELFKEVLFGANPTE